MEIKLIAELEKEINLLESWIKNTKSGGWSSQNLDAMEKRVLELKGVLYDIHCGYYNC